MQAQYRLYWTSDVGFSGTDNVDYPTIEDAKTAAGADLTWRAWERDTWRSTSDKYGDTFTVRKSYR